MIELSARASTEPWDALVESRLRLASTTTSTAPRGLRKVPVRPSPACLAQRGTRRELAEIDPELRTAIRGLVTGQKPWPLYLWGHAGTGKTSAALAVLDYAGPTEKTNPPPGSLHDWFAGYAEIRALAGLRIRADHGLGFEYFGCSPKESTWYRLIDHWTAAPVVVLDEIGIGKETGDFKLDVLIEVLNARCGDPVRPLIVTGNVKPSELPTVCDDRVADRVLAGTVFHLSGPSRRMKR